MAILGNVARVSSLTSQFDMNILAELLELGATFDCTVVADSMVGGIKEASY